MDNLKEMIGELVHTALHPSAAVTKAMRETGKPAVGCFPIYTPEELVYAAGFLPVGMWGGRTELKLADKYLQSFCCSIMRSNMEYGMKGTYSMLSAVVIPTFCDTLKCICENWKAAVPQIPAIPVVYPQNRKLDAGMVYLQEELKRVGEKLGELAGKTVRDQEVETAFELYERYRTVMRDFTETAAHYPVTIDAKTRHLIIKAGQFMDKADYTEKIREVTAALTAREPESFSGIRAVATGLMGEPVELLSLFAENGIAFVADDLAQESRQFRTAARGTGSVWERMACRTADQGGCTFYFEPEKMRGHHLIQTVREKKAQAVVVFMMKFCDPEEFDYPIYKEELEAAGIPMLYLEIDQQLDSFEQTRTRIQSFAEMLM